MTTDTPSFKKKNTLAAKLLRPKVAIPLLILFLILISPWLIRAWYLRGVPDVAEPFETQAVHDFKIAEADNAYSGYAEAVAIFKDPRSDWDLSEKSTRVLTAGWQAADDDIRAYLADNREAFLIWKEATQKDEAQFLPAGQYAWNQPLPIAGVARPFTYGALLIAERHMSESHPEQAWEWYRAAIRFSRHMGKNGGLVERLVGSDCFELTARELEAWLADPAVSKELILQGMQQLEEDWQLTEDNATIIKLECISTLTLIEQIQNGESRVLESESWPNGLNSVDESKTPNLYFYFKGEPELSKRLTKIGIRNHLKHYALPPWQRPERLGEMGLFHDHEGLVIDEPQFTIDTYDRAYKRSLDMMPGFEYSMTEFEADELRYRTLLVVFAGQVFRRDHGRFPETLDELVPDDLDSIPIDTYDGKPLKYRFDPDGPVVYSIFENGTDDGGVDWNRKISSEGRYRPEDRGSQMRLPESELLPPVNPLPEVMQHDRISLPHQRLLFVLPEQPTVAFIESVLRTHFHILE